MRKNKNRILVLLALLAILTTRAEIAYAHPADGYTHVIRAEVTAKKLSVDWEVNPGLLLVAYAWHQVDIDKDNALSQQEKQTWAQATARFLSASIDGVSLPLHLEDSAFPSSLEAFQSGAETIALHFSATWAARPDESFELVLLNMMEPAKSTNWYFIAAQDELKFPTPLQEGNRIAVTFIPPAKQPAREPSLWTEWDSGLPSIPSTSQESTSQPAENAPPSLSNANSREVLLDLIRKQEVSTSFYFLALAISLVLGALHALTPGHGKTIVAAYLVGSRGTSWHAVVLGTVVTLTHTGSVLLLGVVTLAVSQYFLPTVFIPLLELLSGLLILGLGLYLLLQRYRAWRKKPAPLTRKVSLSPVSTRKVSGAITIQAPAAGLHHHGDGKLHSHDVPETITWRSLIALGVSGGLVPCPDAIAILLVAIAINRILLGLALIVSFSLGLALVLIVIGLVMVNSRRLFDRFGAFDRITPVLPVVSAVVVFALGAALTAGAYARFEDELEAARAGSTGGNEAHILYLSGGEEDIQQLFVTSPNGAILLSGERDNVAGYALSPDGSQALYTTRTEKLENSLWLVNLRERERTKLLDCMQALCSRPAFSPDGNEIVYEYLNYPDGKNISISPRWMDLRSGENKPLFKTMNFPGSAPRWSPDGAWLSYSAAGGLRLYNTKTGESRLVESLYSYAAEWAPGGDAILYLDAIIKDDQQVVPQVFVYRLASDTTRNLSPDTDHEILFADWSPDGNWIALIRRNLADERGNQIWLMRSDGSEARALTALSNRAYGSLAWSPDGSQLLYDVEFIDSESSEPQLQLIDIHTGQITDLDQPGFGAMWLAP